MITSRKRSLWQGNVFTPVCQSTHKRAVYPSMQWVGGVYPSIQWCGGVCRMECLPLSPMRVYIPWADTPWTHPLGRHAPWTHPTGQTPWTTPPDADIPLDTPLGRHPLGRHHLGQTTPDTHPPGQTPL